MDARGGWLSLFHPDDADIFAKQAKSLQSNQPDFSEFRIVRKDGEVRWIEDFSRPIFDQKLGHVTKIIGAARDVTEKKQSQLELRVSETRHQMVAELASDYVFEMDVDEQGDLTNSWISESFTRITGYTSEELDQRGGWIAVIHPEDVSAMEKQVERLLSNQTDISEYRIVRKDGEVRWIEEIARPIMDKSSRRVIKIIGAARDITEKKEAQAEIQAQAEKLESIYRAAPVGIGIIRDRMIIDVNERFCEITGYDNQELAGQSTRILYPSEEVYDQVGEERLKERGPTGLFMIETQYKRKDNEIIDIFLSSSPLDPSDHSRGYVFTVLNISEQKKASRELIESEEKFSLVFRNSPFAILVTDHETGQITDVNPAFTEITGYEQDEVIHQTTVDLHLWRDLGDRDLVLDLLSRGHKVIGEEYVFVRKDGEVIYGLYSADLIQLKGKTYILSSIDNITERKRRELELQVVANISEAMRKATSKEDLQKTLVESLINQLDLDGVTFEQINLLNGERKRTYSEGVWKGLEYQTIPAGKGIGGEVIASGSARLIRDTAKEKNLFHKEHFRNLQSAACIPLIIQDTVIGLFWVGSRREMGDLDIRLMTSIADMAANAIHRETMHEETLHRLDELNTLRSIDQAINSSQDLGVTLDMIVSQLKNLITADAIAILIYHPALLTLNYAAGAGFNSEHIKKSSLKLGEGGAGRVALERKPLWIEDLSQSDSECVRKELLMDERIKAYHALPLLVKGEIKGVMEVFHRAPFTANDDWKSTLDTVATQTAIAIDNSEMFHGMKRLNTELILAYDETIEGWANALDLRDHDTEGHSRRVMDHTLRMAREAGMSPEELIHVRRGSLLHDIGKIGVPDAVLRKPGPLTDNEWIIMHEHPRIAFQLLSKIKYLQPAMDIPYCHHEKWDGSGYPRGLKGEEIPLPARLFAVVDVYDALTSDRPYRMAWTREKTLKYIKEQTGTHLDPYAVEIFFKTLDY
jgi:PAS domain S-box-containing protein